MRRLLHTTALRWRALREPAKREDGVVTVFTIIIAVALLLFAGLAYDGGMALDARVRTLNEAQEAARAGAQALNIGALRAGGPAVLDASAAVIAAQTYLAGTGDAGTVSVNGTTVTVSVTHTRQATLLALAGVGAMTAHATASAKAEQGT